MPTGYTAPIANGITFKEYAMGCARAFGALIMMRDDPQDAEIPESFAASNYHSDHIKRDTAELKRISGMDCATAALKAKQAHQKNIAYHNEQISKSESLAEKYRAMLKEVEAYKSPSKDHDNFKKFMREQIEESIRFDCDSDYHSKCLLDQKLLSGKEWLSSEKKRLRDSIKYHKEEHKKEVKRVNERNKWVKKLRESLA
jgi:hypothetical protein